MFPQVRNFVLTGNNLLELEVHKLLKLRRGVQDGGKMYQPAVTTYISGGDEFSASVHDHWTTTMNPS
jgi:hypothetical protein